VAGGEPQSLLLDRLEYRQVRLEEILNVERFSEKGLLSDA
jgi:hypothetical protein